MPDDLAVLGRPRQLDYKLVFDLMPGMCLVLDPAFRIIAQNREHAETTLSTAKNVIGRGLFEVFPDNPGDSGAYGVGAVRQSLLTVLKSCQTDVMPTIQYDVQPLSGKFRPKFWSITNTPILGADGYV